MFLESQGLVPWILVILYDPQADLNDLRGLLLT